MHKSSSTDILLSNKPGSKEYKRSFNVGDKQYQAQRNDEIAEMNPEHSMENYDNEGNQNYMTGSRSEPKFSPLSNEEQRERLRNLEEHNRNKTPDTLNVSGLSASFRHDKFYKRGLKIQKHQEYLQDMIDQKIKQDANSKKMSKNSYRLLISKLEIHLKLYLLDIDKDDRKKITFEQLGRLMTLLEVFRVIQYDPENRLKDGQEFFAKNSKDQKRRYDEMVLHEQIWMLITKDSNAEYSDIEIVNSIFRILLDPARLTVKEASEIIKEFLDKLGLNSNSKINIQDSELDPWSIEELVKNFYQMIENRVAYSKLKDSTIERREKIETEKEKEHTFKPKISKKSEELAKDSYIRFIGEHKILDKENNIPEKGVPQFNQTGNFQTEQDEEEDYGSGVHRRARTRERDESRLTSNSAKGLALTPNERYKIWAKKKELLDEKIKKEMEKKIEEENTLCKFKPELIKKNNKQFNKEEHVKRLYKKDYLKKREDLKKEAEEERARKEIEECTFKPVLNQDLNYSNHEPSRTDSIPAGYEKTVGRLRFGVEENKRKKEAMEKFSKGENYDKIRNSNIKPFSFVEAKKIKKPKPFVHIDVSVAPGRTGRIGLHEGDDPIEVARSFAVAFQLTEDMEENLQKLLIEQMQKPRPKSKK